MNNFRKILVGAAAMAAGLTVAGAASAQATASDNVAINARVIEPISIDGVDDLNFGTFTSPTGGAADIIINAGTGARTTAGPGTTTLITTGALNSSVGRGTFTISGEVGAAINITITPSGVTAPFSIGSVTGSGCAYSAGTGTIAGGSCTLGVGATLTVAQDAAAGTISGGTLTTLVSYQ